MLDWHARKLGLTDLPDHDGKVTSGTIFILRLYYRPKSADRGFLYESLINNKQLIWTLTLKVPIPQNGLADELFECVWPFFEICAKDVNMNLCLECQSE